MLAVTPPLWAAGLVSTLKLSMLHLAPIWPPFLWWAPFLVLVILALTALIDAFTATIPDPLVLSGLAALIGLQGYYLSWPVALYHLERALAAGLLIWGVNMLWYSLRKQDALGMGDAKWTMLAVGCFGAVPVVIAWGAGACLASLWIIVAHMGRYQVTRVTFAPFLLLGLVAGLYWTRYRY